MILLYYQINITANPVHFLTFLFFLDFFTFL
jgi:hypothetical protein